MSALDRQCIFSNTPIPTAASTDAHVLTGAPEGDGTSIIVEGYQVPRLAVSGMLQTRWLASGVECPLYLRTVGMVVCQQDLYHG